MRPFGPKLSCFLGKWTLRPDPTRVPGVEEGRDFTPSSLVPTGPPPETGFPLLAEGLSLLGEPTWTTPTAERVPFHSAPPTRPAFAPWSRVTSRLTAPPPAAQSARLRVSVSWSTRAWAAAASGFLSLGTWAGQMQRGLSELRVS